MFNQNIVVGYVGGDAETRYFPDGNAVANFTVATTEKWKDKQTGELKEMTEWHRIEVFGRQAEFAAEHVKKGAMVLVIGQIKTRKWTDKEGVDRYTTTTKAQDLKMLKWPEGSKPPSSDRGQDRRGAEESKRDGYTPPSVSDRKGREFDDLGDDIPF